jgi:hypothetical protein
MIIHFLSDYTVISITAVLWLIILIILFKESKEDKEK